MPCLSKLNSRLWDNRGLYHIEAADQFLSIEEWWQIQDEIRHLGLISTLSSDTFGFGAMLNLWIPNGRYSPTEIKPILRLTAIHFTKIRPQMDTRAFWGIIEPVVFIYENLQAIKHYKYPEPKEMSYYDY